MCAGAARSQRGGDCDCTLGFVQWSRLKFALKKKMAPPPVERVESVMTSLAGSLRRDAASEQHVQAIQKPTLILVQFI